jgi:hypothetical protein
MRLRINYWGLFFYAAFMNLFAVFFTFAACGRHDHLPMTASKIPFLLLGVNLLLLFLNLLSPTPRLIEVDVQAKTLTYALLFSKQKVVVHYSRIETEWITRRGGKYGPVKVWNCYIDSRKIFSLSEDSYGWPKDQLAMLHDLLPKRHA